MVALNKLEMITAEKPRILVVDDDDSIRGLMVAVLRRQGFEVESARDGTEAIEKLAVDDYDAILLDLMMPRVDGFGVMRYLRSRGDDALKSVIVLTAADIESVYAEPVHTVIRKPFDLQKIIEATLACSRGNA
jgi:CheY-like chemotaxis protein